MLKYRFNVGDALERVGFNTYKAKTTGLLSQDTLKKYETKIPKCIEQSVSNSGHAAKRYFLI